MCPDLEILITWKFGCYKAWKHVENQPQINSYKPLGLGTHPPQGGVPPQNPTHPKPMFFQVWGRGRGGRGGRGERVGVV